MGYIDRDSVGITRELKELLRELKKEDETYVGLLTRLAYLAIEADSKKPHSDHNQ